MTATTYRGFIKRRPAKGNTLRYLKEVGPPIGGLAVVMPDGTPLPGQLDTVVNIPFDDAVTVKVTLYVHGLIAESPPRTWHRPVRNYRQRSKTQ